jgi:hypothetical protein
VVLGGGLLDQSQHRVHTLFDLAALEGLSGGVQVEVATLEPVVACSEPTDMKVERGRSASTVRRQKREEGGETSKKGCRASHSERESVSGKGDQNFQKEREIMLVCNNLEVNNTINLLYKALFMNWIFK